MLLKRTPSYIYAQIRPFFPTTDPVCLNGVPIHERKRMTDEYVPDFLVSRVQTDDPSYESQYVSALEKYVSVGESVTMIGGGEGVSAVVAANQVQSTGTVEVYEGSLENVQKTRSTISVNGVGDVVTVHHSIVSDYFTLRGDPGDANVTKPGELEECDTLAIDADGAEFPILESIEIAPERLITEHHAVRNDGELVAEYRPDELRALLERSGYDIVDEFHHPTRAYGELDELVVVAEQA